MRRVVVAGMIGNGLEWYDFALYGYFAPVIGKLFFPGHDVYVQMIATYGVFAAGFIMRPVGAVFFGYLGDKFGRRFSLALSILMMAFPTAFIGLLPTYASIGIWAPILLTIIRLLQGLSLAGQFSGSIAFIVEHAPMERRGIAGSTTVMSLCAGMLLGSLVATIFSTVLNQADFESWGWRVPFILGIVIAFVGFYIRSHTTESPHYELARDEGRLSKTPVSQAFRGHIQELLRGIGVYLAVTVPFYTLTVFFNFFMLLETSKGGLGLPDNQAYLINTLSMVLMMIMLPFTAHLTDKIGRKLVLMWTAVAYFFAAFPVFFLMNHGGFTYALIADIIFTVIVAFYVGAVPALLVELFPTSIRYTGMSISYNVAAVIGGMTPMLETWLVGETRINTIAALYVYIALCVCVSFIVYRIRSSISCRGFSIFYKIAALFAIISVLLGPWLVAKEQMNTVVVVLYIMLCSLISFIAFIGYHDSYKEKLA